MSILRLNKGIFFDVEGPDGTGKTGLVQALGSYFTGLLGEGQVVLTREPQNPIRKLTHDPDSGLCEKAVHFLFCADRAQNVETIIVPALAQNQLVISDRFSMSALAYQHYGAGLPYDMVAQSQSLATDNVKPNFTLFLNVDAQLSFSRAGGTDRYEKLGLDFQRDVYDGYMELVKRGFKGGDPIGIINVIDTMSKAEVLGLAIGLLEQRFPELKLGE